MKPEELRIGNWVLYNDKECEVFDIGMKNGVITPRLYPSISVKAIPDYRVDVSNIEPMELTEDWLVKLGFEKKCNEIKEGQFKGLKSDVHFFKDWVRFYHVSGDGWFQLKSVTGFVPISIGYVHQLQNLYFALTQTELTIKP